jgi:neutral amino acid transport system substrate-binding protein
LVGPIDFDEDGDVSAPFAILQADGTSWTDASTIQPSDL